MKILKIFLVSFFQKIKDHLKFTNNKSVVFFSPEAGIVSFHETLLRLQGIINALNISSYFYFCNSALENCGVHMVQRLFDKSEHEKKKCCNNCLKYSIKNFPWSSKPVFINKKSIKVKIKSKTLNRLKQLCLLNPLRLRAEIVNGPRQYKKTEEFSKVFESVKIIYTKSSNLFKNLKNAQYIHFNNYTLGLAGRLAAFDHKKNSSYISHASLKNNSSENIVIHHGFDALQNRIPGDRWREFCDRPLPTRIIQLLYDDLLIRLLSVGSHTWSPKTERCIYEKDNPTIKFRKNKTTKNISLILLTSSDDEMLFESLIRKTFNLQKPKIQSIFNNQEDWITRTAEIAHSKKILLIIRIHPRTKILGNKCRISRLCQKISKKYSNLKVIYPDHKVSTYDLCLNCDKAIYGWSSMGLELSCLGTPVQTYQRGHALYTPESLGCRIRNISFYFSEMEKVNNNFKLSDLVKAWRINALVNLGNSIHIGDEYYRNTNNKALMKSILLNLNSPLKYYQEELNWNSNSENDERNEIIKRLSGIMYYLTTGKKLIEGAQPIILESKVILGNLIFKKNKMNSYTFNGIKVNKGSNRILSIIASAKGDNYKN